MPHKHNAARRHHIPKMVFKVQNWPAYEGSVRRRGSLTLWIEEPTEKVLTFTVPGLNLEEVIHPDDRRTRHRQQGFRQLIQHLRRLTRVSQGRNVRRKIRA